MTIQMKKNRHVAMYAWILAVTLAIAGVAKFYHYNYVANTPGQARSLRLPGFDEFVCRGVPYVRGGVDQCGKRSVYADGDWGITAYFTIYGIDSTEEARAIANFMVEARKKSGQEKIPMNVVIYSVPRSAGSSNPRQYKILEEDL